MFEEEFKMWYIDPISKTTLIKLAWYINNLRFLENGFFYFIEFLYSNNKGN